MICQEAMHDHMLKALLPVSDQLSLPKSLLQRCVLVVLKTQQKLDLQSASLCRVIYKDALPTVTWWRYLATHCGGVRSVKPNPLK